MKYVHTKLAFFSLLLVMALSSCTLEEDLDPITGDNRDKFTGTWMFSETEVARAISYPVTISYDPSNSAQVLLSNMGNLGSSKRAYGIVTTSRIVIPQQEVPSSGITIEGTGTLTNNSTMHWEFSITGGGDINYYEATATK